MFLGGKAKPSSIKVVIIINLTGECCLGYWRLDLNNEVVCGGMPCGKESLSDLPIVSRSSLCF